MDTFKKIYSSWPSEEKNCFLTFYFPNMDKTIINTLNVDVENENLGLKVFMVCWEADVLKVCLEVDFENRLDDKELFIDLSSIKDFDSDLEDYVDNYLDNRKYVIGLTKKELFKFRLDDILEHRKDLKKNYLGVSTQIDISAGKYATVSVTLEDKKDYEYI